VYFVVSSGKPPWQERGPPLSSLSVDRLGKEVDHHSTKRQEREGTYGGETQWCRAHRTHRACIWPNRPQHKKMGEATSIRTHSPRPRLLRHDSVHLSKHAWHTKHRTSNRQVMRGRDAWGVRGREAWPQPRKKEKNKGEEGTHTTAWSVQASPPGKSEGRLFHRSASIVWGKKLIIIPRVCGRVGGGEAGRASECVCTRDGWSCQRAQTIFGV
jgi:hypothetical protein